MPDEVVTDGVKVRVDVPCGVPITRGVGATCGLALVPPPAHPTAPNTDSDARTASAATRSNATLAFQGWNLEAKRSSTKAAVQDASNENTCSQTNGGSRGACGGDTFMVLAVVLTVTT